VLDAVKATAFGERFERVARNLRYSAASLVFTAGQAELGSENYCSPLLRAPGRRHPQRRSSRGRHCSGPHRSRIASSIGSNPAPSPLDGKAAVEIRIERGDLTFAPSAAEASARA